jgi:hypothetical protein
MREPADRLAAYSGEPQCTGRWQPPLTILAEYIHPLQGQPICQNSAWGWSSPDGGCKKTTETKNRPAGRLTR